MMTSARWNGFLQNQAGSVAVTAAVAMSGLLSLGALALQSGNLYVDKRQQQTANDLAAVAAASYLGGTTTSGAASAASAAVQANGYPGSSVSKVEFGTYVSNPAIAAALRFTPGGTATPNAVRITLRQSQPYIFGSLLGTASASMTGTNGPTATAAMIQTQSVAAVRSAAAFHLGTGTANLNSGILNSTLGALVGSSLSLSLMDYQALASTNVNLFSFSNALAHSVGVNAGTFSTLASATVSLPNALRALTAALPSSSASAALSSIVTAVGAQTSVLQLGKLVNYGSYATSAIGTVPSQAPTISALGLLTALLQAANGLHQLQTGLAVSLPGVVSANVTIAVGEPPTGSSTIAIGPAGTTITSAQTRVLLNLQLVGPPGASLLNVPILLDVASGTATLNSVACTNADVTTAAVQLGVMPGLASAWVGTVSAASLRDMATPLSPSPATLVNVLSLAQITGQGAASIANTNPTAVPFNAADIQASTAKTVSTSDYLATLLTSLFANTSLNVWVLGLNILGTQALNTSILQTLAADTAPIDSILTSVLSAVGVSVGNATVWVSGVQCGQGALVN